MNDETALLQAITANADEDTPRLVYADWLDEHDAPIQAEFIRVQCRLARATAADPDYPDLIERHAELVAQFRPMAKMTTPELPPGFAFDDDRLGGIDSFRRGFLDAVRGDWSDNQMEPIEGEVEQFCAGLPQLIATTTARRLNFGDLAPEQLASILNAPGAERLRSLAVMFPGYETADGDHTLRVLAGAPMVVGLEQLHLYGHASVTGLRALQRVKFDRLTHINLPMLTGRARDLTSVTTAKWFGALRNVVVGGSDAALEGAIVAALAKLPHLDALDLRCQSASARQALGAVNGFPALTRLALWDGPTEAHAARMAKARFPRLAEFNTAGATTGAMLRLIAAKWFPQIRVLELTGGKLTDKFAVALSKSEGAANLRILRLGNSTLGAGALAALADGTRFPNLTTLTLESDTRTPKVDAAVTFAAALSLPRLRHLDLSGWPLGDSGAKALAANPALANLTRLSIERCDIGERGFAALVRSPHLQRLIELNAGNNNLKKAAALLDTMLLPKLTALRLGNPLTLAAREALHRARGWIA